jgi:hypothetical protein
MAKYLITETSYIDGKIVQEYEEIIVPDETRPGPHWTPKDDAARKAAKDIKPGKVNPIEDLADKL